MLLVAIIFGESMMARKTIEMCSANHVHLLVYYRLSQIPHASFYVIMQGNDLNCSQNFLAKKLAYKVHQNRGQVSKLVILHLRDITASQSLLSL